MFGKILMILLFVAASAITVDFIRSLISDIRDSRRKYVKLFAIEGTTVDNLLTPKETLYYESIYGMTDTGRVKLLRKTMEYTTKEAAKGEKEMLMEVLTKKYIK